MKKADAATHALRDDARQGMNRTAVRAVLFMWP
jgi:hypothetical protein